LFDSFKKHSLNDGDDIRSIKSGLFPKRIKSLNASFSLCGGIENAKQKDNEKMKPNKLIVIVFFFLSVHCVIEGTLFI